MGVASSLAGLSHVDQTKAGGNIWILSLAETCVSLQMQRHASDSPESSSSSSRDLESLIFGRPKLLSHKSQSQVILCDFHSGERIETSSCILKIFPPKSSVAYEKELSIYTHLGTQNSNADAVEEITPTKFWSGVWSAERYQEFLGGRLPTVLRRTDTQVDVLVLSYVENICALSSDETSEVRLHAANAALRSLQALHSNEIVHGDISVDNVLFQRNGNRYDALWIDFSASVINASRNSISREWKKAVDYFAHMVLSIL
jgi:serine/threonine protein kinase